MAKKKQTRKQLLKTQDEFITFSARTILFAKNHSTQLTYAGLAVVAIILIYLGVNTYTNYTNRKGQEAYNVAYYALIKTIESEANADSIAGSREQFERVIKGYANTKAGRLALPQLAFLRFKEKNYDEAILLYERYINRVKNKPSYQSLGKMALAACYEEKGEPQKAIEILEKLYHDSDTFIVEQAMLSLARLYRLTDQPEQAKIILRDFVEQYQESPFLPLAKAYLNSLS